jgi:hypothetical protein
MESHEDHARYLYTLAAKDSLLSSGDGEGAEDVCRHDTIALHYISNSTTLYSMLCVISATAETLRIHAY